ncbi:MAG: class I SAM-dependent methyltransferase [Ignavibacteriae bacterium]|nr:class I SAM-dependent methyltransferase [Ignavibacteriota bacterium]MCB9214418.1 class I SAM-dependent methyltransferase [Ignavibacteria bacterium]
MNLQTTFGSIDIYLFDQLLKGRIASGARILDAGCGGGRNLLWLLKNGFDVSGVDTSADAVQSVRRLAAAFAPHLPAEQFRVADIKQLPFETASFHFVICSAVLHFAESEDAFRRMVRECRRVLKPGGLFFARLASTIGIEDRVELIEGRRYNLPDGSTRFLVDEQMLLQLTEEMSGQLVDPIKTTVVQGLRSMTTWVVQVEGDESKSRESKSRGSKSKA